MTRDELTRRLAYSQDASPSKQRKASRQTSIVWRLYCNEYCPTLQKIADTLGLSRSRVGQLRAEALRRLRWPPHGRELRRTLPADHPLYRALFGE